MKTLSLTQPWATLVAIGAKQIETRSWGTRYRGPLAIHASQGMPGWAEDACYEDPFWTVFWEHFPMELLRKPAKLWFPRGQVIATCTLADCLPIKAKPDGTACVAPDDEGLMRAWTPFTLGKVGGSSGAETTEHETAFGDYTPGRYGWLLENVKPIEPIPARGSLGLWDWTMPTEVAV